jgi:hypothetical protein
MARQKLLQISVVVLLLATASAQASSLSISINGRGLHFSASNRHVVRHSPRYRHTTPQIISPQPRILVPRRHVHVHRPLYRPAIKHCASPVTVTIWITNSNGSQQPIVLTKTGRGYRGPRGEYYTIFPSNRQLRRAYGF